MLATEGTHCTLFGISEVSVKVVQTGREMPWQANWLQLCVSCSPCCPASKQSCRSGGLYEKYERKSTLKTDF